MSEFNLLEQKKIKHIHFIGIGGISMSGLAEILMNLGYKISGSDIKSSPITMKLEKLGAKISYTHDKSNIVNPDLVVFTAAVNKENPELQKAISDNIPTIDRATLLGQIMKKYPYSIAISGTHGKTTTTSMVSMIMLESNLDPTIHVGGVLSAINGNTKIGDDKYFVTEACEYVESFLKFYPYLAIVLNIEEDHLDYFKDLDHIKSSFTKFISLIPKDGHLIANIDDPNTKSILDNLSCNLVTYGLHSSSAMWSARNIVFDDLGCATFNLVHNKKSISKIKLRVPGIHNVSNALAAISACRTLGCNIKSIKEGLRKFTGTHRRFELKGIWNNIKVIDDYAHHPSEVKATLKAAKNCTHGRIWCVFQPHTYTRTKALLNEFSHSFNMADKIIISDIYAAREKDTGEINSKTLSDKLISNSVESLYISDFESIVEYLEENVSSSDLIITMGAGDIYKVGEMFLENKEIMAVV